MKYDKMTQSDFDRLLIDVVDSDSPLPSTLMQIPGVYEILAEHYNDDVLTLWEQEQEQEASKDDEA